jgi:hypothetical protein
VVSLTSASEEAQRKSPLFLHPLGTGMGMATPRVSGGRRWVLAKFGYGSGAGTICGLRCAAACLSRGIGNFLY